MDNRISEEIDQVKKGDQTAISKLYQENYAVVLFAIRSVVINLFYFEQMSAKEIADEIGASVTLVNTRLALGRKRVEKKVLEMEKRERNSTVLLRFRSYFCFSIKKQAGISR